MKKNVLILMVLIAIPVLIGCSGSKANTTPSEPTSDLQLATLLDQANLKKAEISIRYEMIVPDTARVAMTTWITETIQAASSRMSAGDYEDPEDLVDEVTDQAKEIFATKMVVRKLNFVSKKTDRWRYVDYDLLTPSQKKVFDFLNQ